MCCMPTCGECPKRAAHWRHNMACFSYRKRGPASCSATRLPAQSGTVPTGDEVCRQAFGPLTSGRGDASRTERRGLASGRLPRNRRDRLPCNVRARGWRRRVTLSERLEKAKRQRLLAEGLLTSEAALKPASEIDVTDSTSGMLEFDDIEIEAKSARLHAVGPVPTTEDSAPCPKCRRPGQVDMVDLVGNA